jgi:hypothetical protein
MTTRQRRGRAGWAACVAVLLSLPALPIRHAASFPVYGDQTVLPPGTELNEDALDEPREQFRTEAVEGIRSYLAKLGDIAFNSPMTLGAHQRDLEPQVLHPGPVETSGHLRYDQPAVQSQGGQQLPRSGSNSEPARRALSGALRK